MKVWQLVNYSFSIENGTNTTVEAMFKNYPSVEDFYPQDLIWFQGDDLEQLVSTGRCVTYSSECDEESYTLVEAEVIEN
tara:strand:- start:4834 stop:5070 length:237 start_codon:yes stop_codon:yes gene_type:complete